MSEPVILPVVHDIPIVIRAMEDCDDWYRVERAEHDGRSWLEGDSEDGNVQYWCVSARLTPRHCVEGSAAEMVELCRGVLSGEPAYFDRCATDLDVGGAVGFWSPRQGRRSVTYISLDRAREAARVFLEAVL